MKPALYTFGRTLRAIGAFVLTGWVILSALGALLLIGCILVGMVQGVLR